MVSGGKHKCCRLYLVTLCNKCQLGLGHELDKIPYIYLGLRLPEISGKGGHNDLPTVDLGLVR